MRRMPGFALIERMITLLIVTILVIPRWAVAQQPGTQPADQERHR
jgi:Tfp pilus assembly protein PilE